MPNAKNLLGQTFDRLTVVESAGTNHRGDRLWLCGCVCGGTVTVKTGNLTSGKTKSCGCIATGPKASDIRGERFGRLIAKGKMGRDKDRGTFWMCKCDCGNETIVRIGALRSGQVISCGCAQIEVVSAFKGEANPNFNPNLTEEDRIRGRNIASYRTWARRVKRKDGVCQVCGTSEGRLASHHLDNYMDFPELRSDVSNGVLLCTHHHLKFHKEFGFKGTTREQFYQFKENEDERV